MGVCCKCEEYEWPDAKDQKVVWIDPADKKEYCVFHAPAGEKWKDLGGGEKHTNHEFIRLIYKRIDDVKKEIADGDRSSECKLNGTVFPGYISFALYGENGQRKSLPSIDFGEATFSAKVEFTAVLFQGAARFRKTKFCDEAWFSYAKFGNDAIFSGATFSAGAHFNNVKFNKRAVLTWIQAKDRSIRLHPLALASLEHMHFTPLDLPAFSFLACEWPDRLGPETHGDGSPENLKGCEELYRAMKQRAISEHDMPMASRWHGKEKEMALRRIQMETQGWTFSAAHEWFFSKAWPKLKQAFARAWEKIKTVAINNHSLNALPRTLFATRLFRVSWWYNLSSGFGENPAQAARVLCALVVVVLGLMAFPDMREPGKEVIFDPGNGERIYAALQHLLFITNPQYAPASAFLRSLLLVLTRLVIPIQAALFGFAMFNRFRR